MSPSSIKSKHRSTPSRAQHLEKNEINPDKRSCVLELLDGKKMTWTELREATGYPDATLSDTLGSLIHDDLIIHPGKYSKYVRVKDIDLMDEETKGLALRLYKQRITKVIDRMRAANEEKVEDTARAHNEFIARCLYVDKTLEAIRRKKIIRELISESSPPRPQIEAENLYEKYMKRSEQRMMQDAKKLADRLENEKGVELKKKIASALSRKDESGAYNLHLMYKDLGI